MEQPFPFSINISQTSGRAVIVYWLGGPESSALKRGKLKCGETILMRAGSVGFGSRAIQQVKAKGAYGKSNLTIDRHVI